MRSYLPLKVIFTSALWPRGISPLRVDKYLMSTETEVNNYFIFYILYDFNCE